MSSKAPAVGIDLGTTYSCVAVFQNGNVEIIANEQGNRTTPSIVAFNEVERLVGETADEETIENATNVIRDAKRMIGRNFDDEKIQANMKRWPFKVIDSEGKPKVQVKFNDEYESYYPEQISAMVLEKMKKIAEDYLGKEVKDAVITVPAYFTDGQRQATTHAGEIAGLNVLRVINEPTAAAFAYGLEKKKNFERKVLIFDLGGGTFDVSILSVQGGSFEVKGYGGDSNLGGEDFNNNLIDHFAQEFEQKHGKILKDDRSARARLRMACEKAKRTLTTATSAKIVIDNLFEGINFSSMITRAKFESLNTELFRKTITEVDSALKAAKLTRDSIDEVVLVGGSTRIPKIQKLLQEFFDGKEPYKSINPDEAVAYGAAIHAAIVRGDLKNSNMKDFKFADVTPLSLGTDMRGDIMKVIIPRNTLIPAEGKASFTTVTGNQSCIKSKILEGERLFADENNLLGEMYIDGIPELPRGGPTIEFTFNVNADGVLHVSAVETKSGVKAETTIKYDQKRLNKNQLDKMVGDAEKYREEDETKRRAVKVKNDLEMLCYDIQHEVEYERKLSDDDKKKMLEKCEEIIAWMAAEQYEKEEYEEKKKELEEMYKSVE